VQGARGEGALKQQLMVKREKMGFGGGPQPRNSLLETLGKAFRKKGRVGKMARAGQKRKSTRHLGAPNKKPPPVLCNGREGVFRWPPAPSRFVTEKKSGERKKVGLDKEGGEGGKAAQEKH